MIRNEKCEVLDKQNFEPKYRRVYDNERYNKAIWVYVRIQPRSSFTTDVWTAEANSTSIDSWYLVNKLNRMSGAKLPTISKIRPIGPSFLYFVYEFGFFKLRNRKTSVLIQGCRNLFWQKKNSRNCALRFFSFSYLRYVFYLLSFLTF